ncbi:hypothetical protein BKA82DRAFT_1006285 [Pisolithus tinctorius]|uniref:Uncharacterized protein n=1 Tax=Pisolithus tinctorius Marx 270 TaxID=870435 RepID=A0A0C3NPB9_PISTI|nr:hypothetical protein BKA82DRAFT_1006285 [Pisolithus tinctorius]KIN97148.1 hypothetical protein M404DRAFT_1006285 [Pisolithus tinctorius Marx 270]
MTVEAGEAPTTLPTSKDASGAEVGMAGSDELLAAQQPASSPVKITAHIMQVKARVVSSCTDYWLVQAVLCRSRRDTKNWERSALPQLPPPRRPPSSPPPQHK